MPRNAWKARCLCGFWLALWFLGSCPTVWADEPSGEVVAITHGTIHPASGPEIADGTLVIRDGRIVSVGRAAAPPGATVVDVHGQHVYPSLIDAVTTLGLVEIPSVRATRDDRELGTLNANARADLAFNADSMLLPVAMSAGVLAAGVVPRGAGIAGRAAVMQLFGWNRKDMTIKAPAAVVVYWPEMRIARQPWSPPVKKQEQKRREALRQIDEAFENARAYLKPSAAGPGAPPERDVQWDALAAAIRREVPVMIVADGVDEIHAAMKWARKQDVRMILVGGGEAWRIAKDVADAHVPVIYSHLLDIDFHDYDRYDVFYRAPAVLTAAGVPVALSVGWSGADVRWLSDLAGRAHAYGLTQLQGLQAVTLRPAEMLGVSDRLGSLQPGKDATFFIADGDILDTRTHVLRAWVRGKEIDLNDRQKKLWEKYRNRPAP